MLMVLYLIALEKSMKCYVVGETLVIESDETKAASLLQNNSITDVLEVEILGEGKDTALKIKV